MRRKIVAGNWKMNLTREEALTLIRDIERGMDADCNVELIVLPPFLLIPCVQDAVQNVQLGAQNFFPSEKGAFTGEISILHLVDFEIRYVLIGHSERRHIFNESNLFLKQKVDIALDNGLTVIFCVGETLEERDSGNAFRCVERQLKESLFHVSPSNIRQIVIAYEPVWAIGTGKTATSEQAEEMHAFIRSALERSYGAEVAENIPILYGGSCTPENAAELFDCPNVDGGLIGGASLHAQSFCAIASSF
jgi:triosephosphate isomerase